MNSTWTAPALATLEAFLAATGDVGPLPVVWADEDDEAFHDGYMRPEDTPEPWPEPSDDELVAIRQRLAKWGVKIEEDEVEEEGDAEPSPEPEPEPKQTPRKKTNRDDKSLSELELAQDWMETPEADLYLHADALGWRRYEKGRWRAGAHELYQDLAAFVRDRVETTMAARSLNRNAVIKSAMAYVCEHRAVPADSFDANPMIVAFPDGTVLDVKSWTRRPATREDRICKTLAVSPADEPSQQWADFVFESLSHYPEDRRDAIAAYLQEWCGHGIDGRLPGRSFSFSVGNTRRWKIHL